MPSSIHKKQPRLKESCDHCSAAKVRCTKDKPACLRCAQKGYECTYSHSRRAGRRNMNASRSSVPISHSRTPSETSSWSESHPSPPCSDDSNSDIFDMWTVPAGTAPTSAPDYPMLQPMWEDDIYNLSNARFDQASQLNFMHSAPILPDASMTASPPSFHAMPMPQFDTTSTDFLGAPELSRASSTGTLSTQDSYGPVGSFSGVSPQHADAVHDELRNLSSFAEMMEKKFDGVVKTRLQYRDVYSEFGVPAEELENSSDCLDVKRSIPVPTPDPSELAFYYSLAEMKRRLRWLKEDFGKMVGSAAV